MFTPHDPIRTRTRTGGEWTTSRIACLVQQGLRLLAATEGGDFEEHLEPVDAKD